MGAPLGVVGGLRPFGRIADAPYENAEIVRQPRRRCQPAKRATSAASAADDEVHDSAAHDDHALDRLARDRACRRSSRISRFRTSFPALPPGTEILPRTLPLTCTGISSTSARSSAGSDAGQGS